MSFECLLQNLERSGTLAADERLALRQLWMGTTKATCTAHTHIALAGEASSVVILIVDGIAYRHVMLPNGRRQVTGYLIRGDLCNIDFWLLDSSSETITALTAVEIAAVSRASLFDLMAGFPRMMHAFWRLTLADQLIARQWLTNITHRSALEATAHLLCELFTRLEAAGLADRNCCNLHMTQRDLADSLALSLVHVNRTLMELRRRKLISFHRGRLFVLDFAALRTVAGFSADYLGHAASTPLIIPRKHKPSRDEIPETLPAA